MRFQNPNISYWREGQRGDFPHYLNAGMAVLNPKQKEQCRRLQGIVLNLIFSLYGPQ